MIQEGTKLKIVDNSGARIVKCIKVLGGSRKRYARLGDIIVVVVKKAEPRKPVKKHDVVRAVVIRQKRPFRRNDGSYVSFEDNAAVVLEGKTKKPKGGRIFGPVARELREKGFEQIIAIARELA